MQTTETRTYPIGKLCVVAEDGYIVSIHVADDDCICDDELVHDALNQLEEYFGGQRKAFSFKMKYSPCTAFQADVWDALQTIPYGKTVTYGELAELSGHKGAARAVGNAVHKNNLLIAVPCHRVVAADGIGGFAHGVEMKKLLLDCETENSL